MTKKITDTASSIIVPVNVDAICSGTQIPTLVQPASAQFDRLPYTDTENAPHNSDTPYLGEFASSSPKSTDHALPGGVHIHWSLPDGLTNGEDISANSDEDADAGMNFPAVPNRWLVVRVFTDRSDPSQPKISTRGWVIESDYLEKATPEILASRQVYTQIPLSPDQSDWGNMPYLLMGRKVDFESWKPTTFNAINKLTAVGYGTEDFAAYYPNCMTVFGFHDAAQDLETLGSTGELSYVVMGWFSDSDDDPVIGKTLADLQAQFKWTLPENSPQTDFSSSVYSGVIAGIKWNPETDYNLPSEVSDVRVGVGHNTSEALSVLVENLTQEQSVEDDPPDVQTLLNALQQGSLSQLIENDLDAPIKMLKSIHQAMFDAYSFGNQYTIRYRIDDSYDSTTRYTPVDEISVPKDFLGDLNTLNTVSENYTVYDRTLESAKWQLYGDWHKYTYAQHFGLPESVKSTSTDLFQYIDTRESEQISNMVDHNKYMLSVVTNHAQNLTAKIGTSYELIQTPAEPYWIPNDPVLLLSSEDIHPTFRYGYDALLSKDGYLLCRLESQITLSFTAPADIVTGSDAVTVSQSNANTPTLPDNTNFALMKIASLLLFEGFLINPAMAPYLQSIVAQDPVANNPAKLDSNFDEIIANAQHHYIDRSATPKLQFSQGAVAPETMSVRSWGESNPWLPLKTHWWVDYYPITAVSDSSAYDPNCVQDNFDFQNPNDLFQLHLKNDIPQFSEPQSYWGTSLLTPDASLNLYQQLDKFLSAHPTFTGREALEEVMSDMLSWNILSQSLDGLREQMLMQVSGMQLGIQDPTGSQEDKNLAGKVASLVEGSINTSASSLRGFDPLRTGLMQLKQIRVIDVFGQSMVIGNQARPTMTTYVARSLEIPSKLGIQPDSTFFLTPRLLQGSRLLFRWLEASGETDTVQMNLNPASSPICGWIVPNFLDQSLMFYDQSGLMLGIMYPHETGVFWQSPPGQDGSIREDLNAFIASSNANSFIITFMQTINTLGTDYLKGLISTLEENEYTIEPEHFKAASNNALLIGRPIALTRCQLKLELLGNPQAIQSWENLDNAVQTNSVNIRNTAGAEKVRFPIKLGDTATLDDGLIGYFLLNDDKTGFNTFYNLRKDIDSHIEKATDDTIMLDSDPNSKPQDLFVLMDPRAKIHATTGILPVKDLSLPPDLYMNMLSQLNYAFLTTPIFKRTTQTDGETPSTLINPEIPLPAVDHEKTWNWVEYDRDQWTVVPNIMDKDSQDVLMGDGLSVTEGWLKLTRKDSEP